MTEESKVITFPASPQAALASVHAAFRKYLCIKETDYIDVTLAAVSSIGEDDLPLWIMLVASSSAGKTELLWALRDWPDARFLSKLTAQTLASGWREDDDKGKDAKHGLLNRLKSGSVLIFKDFTSVLKLKTEARNEILSQLREIYDGGFDAEYGTGQAIHWHGKLGVVAGVTPIIDEVSPYQQMLGERFLTVRIVQPDQKEMAGRAIRNRGREAALKGALSDAIRYYAQSNRTRPAEVEVSEAHADQLTSLAVLIAIGRSNPRRDWSTKQIVARTEAESSPRLARQLDLLARCLASVRGRSVVSDADAATSCGVGFDSLTAGRKRLLLALWKLDSGDGVKPNEVAEELGLPWSTTKRHLEDLCAIEGGLLRPRGQDGFQLTDLAREHFRKIEGSFPSLQKST